MHSHYQYLVLIPLVSHLLADLAHSFEKGLMIFLIFFYYGTVNYNEVFQSTPNLIEKEPSFPKFFSVSRTVDSSAFIAASTPMIVIYIKYLNKTIAILEYYESNE